MSGQLLDESFVAELAEIVRYRRKNGLWGDSGRASDAKLVDPPVLVKNTETEDIPAYGCMQVDGTVDEDGRNYVKVKKPTSSGRHYLFNTSRTIEASGYGTAQVGARVRAYKNSGTVTFKQLWAPTAGQWYLTQGSGRFPAIGTDDVDTNVFWVRADFNDVIHFKSGAGGIAAMSGTTLGSATCRRYDCTTAGALSDSGEDVTVYNTAAAFAASTYGIAALNDAGLWVAIVEKCA